MDAVHGQEKDWYKQTSF